MTMMLEKAFNEATKLPKIEQNALARWVLAELESDRKWDKLFAESEDELAKLATEALEDENNGDTTAMDFNKLWDLKRQKNFGNAIRHYRMK